MRVEITRDFDNSKIGDLIDADDQTAADLVRRKLAKPVIPFNSLDESVRTSMLNFHHHNLNTKKLSDPKDGDYLDTEVNKRNIKENKNKVQKYLESFNFKEILENIYYDENQIFWVWKNNRWVMCDETDILLLFRKIGIETEQGSVKSYIINLSKQGGRTNKPREPSKTVIQFKDCLYDIDRGEQFEPSKNIFITNVLPYKLGESEDTPTIDRLIREWVVREGVQDETYVKTMYEVIAYCVCNEKFLQRIIALTGGGSNGKGTFMNLLRKFLGNENVCASNLRALTTRNFETSALYKKKVCFFSEAEKTDIANTNIIKQLSGEDIVRDEFKGKTPFSEESQIVPIIATNSLPLTPDKSTAFFRRFLNLLINLKNMSDLIAKYLNIYENNFLKNLNFIVEKYFKCIRCLPNFK